MLSKYPKVGLAVGDTQEEREKATLSKLALQVYDHTPLP